MENTDRVRFGDDPTAQWFVAIDGGGGYVGPLSSSDVYHRIMQGEFTWAHFIWKEGEKTWTRVCDHPAFAAVVPSKPPAQLQKDITGEIQVKKSERTKTLARGGKPPAMPGQDRPVRDWYLYYNDSQFGPFAEAEIGRLLKTGKINPKVHAWRDGMNTWLRIEEISSFDDYTGDKAPTGHSRTVHGPSRLADTKIAKDRRPEQRETPRRPMVARILMSNNESVIVAVCRDISVGGMQVLTDRVPGPVGTKIKLNVSPSGDQGLQPFIAEGMIVRVLEDGLGFSFRFDKIANSAVQSLEEYIASEPG